MEQISYDRHRFARRLRLIRQARGLDQTELGELSAIPRSSISRFESGRRRPGIDHLAQLASALQVSTDFLLGQDGQQDDGKIIEEEVGACSQLQIFNESPKEISTDIQSKDTLDLVGLTARITTAYVSNNTLRPEMLSGLIIGAYQALSTSVHETAARSPAALPVAAKTLARDSVATSRLPDWYSSLEFASSIHNFSKIPVSR